jgi:hypothetical protein
MMIILKAEAIAVSWNLLIDRPSGYSVDSALIESLPFFDPFC